MSLITRFLGSGTEWASGNNQPHITVNEMVVWAMIRHHAAVAKGTSTPPGGPAEGDYHIVGSAPTGAWAGYTPNNIAYYHNASWHQATAIDRMHVWVDNAGSADLYQYDAVASPDDWLLVLSGSTTTFPMWVPVHFSGTPTGGNVIGRYTVCGDIDFAANFSGSKGSVETNPGATYDIDVMDDALSIGTVSISTGGAFTFTTTSGTAKTVLDGSKLEFVAPSGSPDETSINGISFMLRGTTTDV